MLVGWSETIKDDCTDAARNFYSEKIDNSIIAFGKAGKNVVSRLSGRAVMGTELVSVDSNDGISHRDIFSAVGRKLRNSFRNEMEHMEYVRNIASSAMGGRIPLDFITGKYGIGRLNVDKGEFNTNPDRTSARILSSTSNSSSFILFSNFGEMISQRMHIAVSELLSKRGIPHLNVITVPRNTDSAGNELVDSGLAHLRKSGAKIVTYEEGSYQDSFEYFPGEFYNMVAKKLCEFSKRLAGKASLIKTQILNA